MNFTFWNLNSNLKPFRNPESPPPSPSPSRGEGWGGGAAIRSPKSAFERGFTLIEIIIVIVILSIVSGITVKFVFDGLRIHTMTINQKTLLDEGRLALERMCRDIRDARIITSPVAPGSASSITFTRTNATSGDVIDENITFTLTGSTLEKVKGGVGYGIASNVSVFTVTRTAANDEIQIDLTLYLASGETVTLRTKIYPKNLLQNATRKNFFYCWEELRS